MTLVRLNSDLFATEDVPHAHSELILAFEMWLSSLKSSNRITHSSSVAVYEAMWTAFAGWCVLQDPVVTLANMNELDLRRFLSDRSQANEGRLSNRHAWRLLALVDRVQKHSAQAAARPANAAPSLVFGANASLRQANLVEGPPLDYLSTDKAAKLVNYLRGVRTDAVGARRLSGWQELRSLAAVGLHLGAGLTPGDVRALTLDAPQHDGFRIRSVKVPADGNRPARESPIAKWAAALLDKWLQERQRVGLPIAARPVPGGAERGPYLFPAAGGRQWSKTAHFEAVNKVLAAAGIDTGTGGTGGLRLRHTFAVRQLRHGKSAQEVARYLGIAKVDEMARFLAVVGADDDVV